jgi:hypothetical protein
MARKNREPSVTERVYDYLTRTKEIGERFTTHGIVKGLGLDQEDFKKNTNRVSAALIRFKREGVISVSGKLDPRLDGSNNALVYQYNGDVGGLQFVSPPDHEVHRPRRNGVIKKIQASLLPPLGVVPLEPIRQEARVEEAVEEKLSEKLFNIAVELERMGL